MPLLTVRITIAGEEVDAVVNTGASAPVIGVRIVKNWNVGRELGRLGFDKEMDQLLL